MHEQKARIRKQLSAARAAIEPDRKAAYEQAVCNRLFDIIERSVGHWEKAGKRSEAYIGLFSAFGSELSVESLAQQLREQGYQLAFPVAFDDGSMDFFAEDLLAESAQDSRRFDFHAMLPAYRKHQREQVVGLTMVQPGQLSFVVVPGVGFDRQHYRIGYGAGYYDRYLPKVSPQTPIWGVAFNEQMLDSLPIQAHDVVLTGVVTPIC